MLQTFLRTDAWIQQYEHDAAALKVLFHSLQLLLKIFYSVNSQDLPEFCEDNHEIFMNIFLKYLTYDNVLLHTDDDEESGFLERVRTGICEIADLYTRKYEDDFQKLPEFVQIIWGLLTSVGKMAKYDMVLFFIN